MATILIDLNNYDENLEKEFKRHSKVKIINTEFINLDESQPVIFRMPDSTFYESVTLERLSDVIAGHADDLKIQTSRLFDVETKKYVSEFKYRQMVALFLPHIDEIQEYNRDSIAKTITTFSKENNLKEQDVIGALKMALIKTIKGPLLPDILEGYGKEKSEELIKKYLRSYKRRF
ncbi:hypothetical protein OAO42_00110 [Candidatus Izimaplasma bacterium]|nr:hypothetical protein [Candidatus Izimaplasma bacterium]